MELETTRFGCIRVDEAKCYYFPEGLPGFDAARRFTLLPHRPEGGGDSPFRWLQSLDEGALALPVMNPWLACPDYAPTIPGLALLHLGITDVARQGRLYAVVTIPQGDPLGATVNLLAPILVNRETRQGRQVVLQQERYALRAPLSLRESGAPGEALRALPAA